MLKGFLLRLLLLTYGANAVASLRPAEVRVDGGHYYIGAVFGKHDYVAHANTHLAPFQILTTEITFQFYSRVHQWASLQGYQFGPGCNGAFHDDCLSPDKDQGCHPVTNVEWWDAVIFANALSNLFHLKPRYLDSDGKPLLHVPEDNQVILTEDYSADGYRLPTLAEWQVAARGGKPAILNGSYGDRQAGSDREEDVAWTSVERAMKTTTSPVAMLKPNALGLYDMSGNVNEWLSDSHFVEGIGQMYLFCGGSFMMTANTLAQCDLHSPGISMPDIGFRLVRNVHD